MYSSNIRDVRESNWLQWLRSIVAMRTMYAFTYIPMNIIIRCPQCACSLYAHYYPTTPHTWQAPTVHRSYTILPSFRPSSHSNPAQFSRHSKRARNRDTCIFPSVARHTPTSSFHFFVCSLFAHEHNSNAVQCERLRVYVLFGGAHSSGTPPRVFEITDLGVIETKL